MTSVEEGERYSPEQLPPDERGHRPWGIRNHHTGELELSGTDIEQFPWRAGALGWISRQRQLDELAPAGRPERQEPTPGASLNKPYDYAAAIGDTERIVAALNEAHLEDLVAVGHVVLARIIRHREASEATS